MKVYIVNWFSAEPYTNYSGCLKAFASKQGAQDFVDSHQDGPYEVDPDNFNDGYFVSKVIEELVVEE